MVAADGSDLGQVTQLPVDGLAAVVYVRVIPAIALASNRSCLFQQEKDHHSHLGPSHDRPAALVGKQYDRRLNRIAHIQDRLATFHTCTRLTS